MLPPPPPRRVGQSRRCSCQRMPRCARRARRLVVQRCGLSARQTSCAASWHHAPPPRWMRCRARPACPARMAAPPRAVHAGQPGGEAARSRHAPAGRLCQRPPACGASCASATPGGGRRGDPLAAGTTRHWWIERCAATIRSVGSRSAGRNLPAADDPAGFAPASREALPANGLTPRGIESPWWVTRPALANPAGAGHPRADRWRGRCRTPPRRWRRRCCCSGWLPASPRILDA